MPEDEQKKDGEQPEGREKPESTPEGGQTPEGNGGHTGLTSQLPSWMLEEADKGSPSSEPAEAGGSAEQPQEAAGNSAEPFNVGDIAKMQGVPGKSSGKGKKFDLRQFRQIKEGTFERFNLEKYIAPGRDALHGICTILGKDNSSTVVDELGRGAAGRVVRARVNKWEFLRQRLLTGAVYGDEENPFGIKKSNVVYEGELPRPDQVAKVDEWLQHWQGVAKDKGVEFPEELEELMPEKLKETDYILALKFFDPVAMEQLGQKGQDEDKRFDAEGKILQHEVCEPKRDQRLVEVFYYGDEKDEADNLLYKAIAEEVVNVNLKDRHGNIIPLNFGNLSKLEHSIDYYASVDIVYDVFGALQHAHRNGIVVRDVSLKNILLETEVASRTGKKGKREFYHRKKKVRLADLGIAKAISKAGKIVRSASDTTSRDLSVDTMTNMFVGTPYYVSPEQARDAKSVGPESDTFSLGTVLYELITSKRIVQIAPGADLFEAQERIKSTHPRDDFRFVNQQIEETRETIQHDATMPGVEIDTDSMPELVSDEIEDIAMLMLEKNRANRMDEEALDALFKDIISKGLYEKRQLTQEQEDAAGRAGKEAFARAEQRTKSIEAGKDIDGYYEAADLYERAGRLMPRMFSDKTSPEITREDAFGKAIEFYRFVLGNAEKLQGTLHTQIGRKGIEQRIRRLESHKRLEHRRIDQYGLMKRSEKQEEEGLWKVIEENTAWKQYEDAKGPTAWVKKKTHSREKGRWEKASTEWLNHVIQSAVNFRSRRKFNAARAKLMQAREFLEAKKGDKIENKMGLAQEYLSAISTHESEIGADEEDDKRAEKVLGMIEGIERLINGKEFPSATTNVVECYADVSNIGDADYKKYFETRLNDLRELNKKAKREYTSLENVHFAVEGAKRQYQELEGGLSARKFFEIGEIGNVEGQIATAERALHGIDASLAGEDDYGKIKEIISDLKRDCRALGENLTVTTYQWAVANVQRLEEIADECKDKLGIKDGKEKIVEAADIIAELDSATGMMNIAPDYMQPAVTDILKERYGKVKERLNDTADEISELDNKKKLAESGRDVDDETPAEEAKKITAAAVELAEKYVKEKGDLTTGRKYFRMIPEKAFESGALADPDLEKKVMAAKKLFDVYENVRDASKFVKRTRYGLDQTVINRMVQAMGEYKLRKKPEERGDEVFDSVVKNLCQYVERARVGIDGEITYSSYKEIARLREEYDLLERQEKEQEIAISQMDESVRKLEGKGRDKPKSKHEDAHHYTVVHSGGKKDVYEASDSAGQLKVEEKAKLTALKERKFAALSNFPGLVTQFIDAAKDELATTGVSQPPEGGEVYKDLANQLASRRPGMAVEYYELYAGTLPKEASDQKAIKQIVDQLRKI